MAAGRGRRWKLLRGFVFSWQWIALSLLMLLILISAHGCGGGGDGDSDGGDAAVGPAPDTRQRFLQSVGNGFILPTYAELEAEAVELAEAATTFCAMPGATLLEAAQERWRVVMGLWMESELVRFGPAKEGFLDTNIDVPRRVTHADAEGIESRIAGNEPIGPERVGSWPVDEIGLKGIEYLLFHDGGESSPILDTRETTWHRRCDYLTAITSDLHAHLDILLNRWRPDGGNFIALWNTAGDPGNTTFFDVQDAIDDLMREMEIVVDYLVNANLWSLNWVRGRAESWRSGNSIANVRHRIEAARRIYLGEHRVTGENQYGIDDYLRDGGHSVLDQGIRDQFDHTLEALDSIPGPLTEAVVGHEALVRDVREDQARVLLRFLKRRLAEERLGVPVEDLFSSEDGD